MEQTDREKLHALIQEIENVATYVEATISQNNTFPSKTRSGWVEVHASRARSSAVQLNALLKKARSMRG